MPAVWMRYLQKNENQEPAAGQVRPVWTFNTARIKIFITQVRTQHRVKTKSHDKQTRR